MITSSLLPLRSFSLLPTTTASAACRSPPAATISFPRITLGRRRRRRLAASATKSSEEEAAAAAGSANGFVPGLPPAEEDDDELCPVDCVTEFKTDEEFQWYLERSKASGVLLVVDFFRPSCGSCKYIEKGFMRLCKGSRDDGAPVVFLKHNVIDEYDELSEVAGRLRIKVVPSFHFYKGGVLVDSFATRDKERIIAAIRKHTSPEPETTGEERQE